VVWRALAFAISTKIRLPFRAFYCGLATFFAEGVERSSFTGTVSAEERILDIASVDCFTVTHIISAFTIRALHLTLLTFRGFLTAVIYVINAVSINTLDFSLFALINA